SAVLRLPALPLFPYTTLFRSLVTSREGLGIEGERLFALRSLSVPAAGVEREAVEASEAARLFVDRAQGVDARFELNDKTAPGVRSEEHTSELQSLRQLVCRLL